MLVVKLKQLKIINFLAFFHKFTSLKDYTSVYFQYDHMFLFILFLEMDMATKEYYVVEIDPFRLIIKI